MAGNCKENKSNAGRWVRFAVHAVEICLLAVLSGCTPTAANPGTSSGTKPATSAPPAARFTDVTQSVGITFRHHNGATGKKRLPETMGGGCAWLDYDNDGWQDLLLVDSAGPAANGNEAAAQPHHASLALLRNDRGRRFEEVSDQVGLAGVPGYGMGVGCGDFNNDGWIDIYITAVGRNRLYENRRGRFIDVTTASRVGGDVDAWSTSCGWFDYDNDGDLDLFVCNYLSWSIEQEARLNCRLKPGVPAYCPPTALPGAAPYLFENLGDGTFRETADAAGLVVRNPDGSPQAKSLGLVPVDLDRDGAIDLVVANDTVRNFVFHNRQDKTFREIGTAAGIAYDSQGNVRGAMGIDAAYFRNDATLGLGIGNFADEMTALYVMEDRAMRFRDVALDTGLGSVTRRPLTFGLFWFDYDLDGRLDLFAANGHLEPDIGIVEPSQQYRQPPQLFWNAGRQVRKQEFVAVTAGGPKDSLFQPLVGRGATYADYDLDGDLDVVLTGCGERPRLLRNDLADTANWIRFRLEGSRSNRAAIGSWIELRMAGQTLRRAVMPTHSYLSQRELPVTLGLGGHSQDVSARIIWPDGTLQELTNLAPNQTHVIRQP